MAKNGSVKIGNTEMYYASFGSGSKTLVALPGLSDGLATVKGKAYWLLLQSQKVTTVFLLMQTQFLILMQGKI